MTTIVALWPSYGLVQATVLYKSDELEVGSEVDSGGETCNTLSLSDGCLSNGDKFTTDISDAVGWAFAG